MIQYTNSASGLCILNLIIHLHLCVVRKEAELYKPQIYFMIVGRFKLSLGKLLYKGDGKQTAVRILDAKGSIEASGNDSGKFEGSNLKSTNFWTVKTVLEFDGTEIGEGNGLMLAEDREIVFYTTSFTGRPNNSGRSIRGSVNFQAGSTGTLSSLDDKVGVVELEFDANLNYSLKIWEWN
jgi:hypothetical protein